ncbi:hypothetical protein [Helicobacter cappadocius]|uniref:Outer membrane protein n=1 Tax=Helicobacter cappadocius TaxID=3063998 RepID=A0AA90T9W9_9HELI|nr:MULTISPECIES: hypothetical protein [unclassified Helicobacter]MDO7253434.1 hypothetical protein [Helicobacter sp. faydin-H75]MDP2539302.1 hypothetical protein [Helicobacter sp. faydin-H76]
MKKLLFVLMASSLIGVTGVYAATKATPKRNPISNINQKRGAVLGNFTKGSIVDGTRSTGSVRRWYLFSEGVLGSSYTMLGKSQYVSADIGYSTYIRSIESLFGGMSLMAGTEISVPIYLMTRGKSNILSDERPLETKETEGVAGYGLQLPFMAGLEYKGFYIVGLVGYTWLYMKDTYYAASGANPTANTLYDGLIFGGGMGYKISNVVNIGVRYITSNGLTNRMNQTKFDDRAIAEGLDKQSKFVNRNRDIYGVDYQRIYFFLSFIF